MGQCLATSNKQPPPNHTNNDRPVVSFDPATYAADQQQNGHGTIGGAAGTEQSTHEDDESRYGSTTLLPPEAQMESSMNNGEQSFFEPPTQESRPGVLTPSEAGFGPSANGRNGWKFEDVYEAGDELGSGAFGSVYIGRHKLADDGVDEDGDGFASEWNKVAIKCTRPNSLDTRNGQRQLKTYDDMERRCQEIRTLIRLQQGSPSMSKVLYMYEYFMSGRDVYMVTELLGQELDDWRTECELFTERMAIDISKTILQAISYMHSCGVVHRDLKLQNILFKKNGDFKSLKIVDFGLARILNDDESAKDFCGSPGYLAPEIYKGKSYRFEVDMFAFGVLLFRLLSGERPFPANNSQILKRHTVELRYTVQGEDWENVSDAAKDMIRKLLINRQERLTADDALTHPWFKEVGRSMLKVDLTHLQEEGNTDRSKAFARSRARTATASNVNNNRFWIDHTAQMALGLLRSDEIYDGNVVDAAYNDENNRAKGGMICVEENISPIVTTAPHYIGSLEGPYTENVCRSIFFQVVQSVRAMHDAGLAHRNIHVENILVDPFGKVSIKGLHHAHPIVEGVPLTGHFGFVYSWYAFKAPEIDTKFYHTKACDLWSLGAVAYMLMTGLPPFRGSGADLVRTKHNGHVDFSIVNLSGAAQRLILGLLKVDVEERMTIDDVLNSDWMRLDDDYLDQFDLSIAKEGLFEFQETSESMSQSRAVP